MNIDAIKKITVIGAGEMGHGIAECALLAGLNVILYDIKQEYLDKGVQRINDSMDKLFSKGKINEKFYNYRKTMLYPTMNMGEATSGAQVVIEAVPEIIELKHKIFQDLEKRVSHNCILATNTSGISIGQIAAKVKDPRRVVGVHFFNPVVIMKLVEVIRGEHTSDQVMDIAFNLCLKMNKKPIRVEKDTPGFIVNRINSPGRIYLGAVVDAGVAEPEEIDALLLSNGSPMGMFELADFGGLDMSYNSNLHRAKVLHPDYGPYRTLEEKVKAGHLGKKTGKGFYDWSNGRPKIDLNKKTDKIEIKDLMLLKFNEATKLIQSGVAMAKDIDQAMTLGTGDKTGPIQAVKGMSSKEVIERLEYISETYKKESLRPTKLIQQDYESIFY